MLVVADQAPVRYQDPVGLLDPPTLRLRFEPLACGLHATISTPIPRPAPCMIEFTISRMS